MNGPMLLEEALSIVDTAENNFYRPIMYNIIKDFYQVILIFSLTLLGGFQQVSASPIGQPVIALSVIACKQAFLLELFANGLVEYRGFSQAKGTHETQISQIELNSLLKKFDESGFISADNREKLSSFDDIPREAIRFRQGDHESTVYYPNGSKNPLIKNLDHEIIKLSKADQWISEINLYGCQPNTKLAFHYSDIKIPQ